MDQSEFEKQVMEMFLMGDDPVLEGLRTQYNSSSIESREFTGVGFLHALKLKMIFLQSLMARVFKSVMSA